MRAFFFAVLMVSALPAFLGACVPHTSKPVATAEVQSAALECRSLYDDPLLRNLDGRIIYKPNEGSRFPNKAMVSDESMPSDIQKKAVKRWEEIARQCLSILAAAGHVTSATEDIMEKKRSGLRYGLYSGKLSFGAYNIGIVNTEIEMAGIQKQEAESYQKGREIGAQRAQEFYSNLQHQMEMNRLKSQLNSYSYGGKSYWNCSASHVGAGTYYVNCY